ncbi:MAG: rhodanese-like domain-containing protein [Bacilli bacterium]|nr:rhodanese-like domain-containing protein [Bacilli bacterium]
MQWYHYLIIFIASFLLFTIILSFIQVRKASIKLDAEKFRTNMRKGQIVDVRSRKEYQSGHIIGARNISLDMIVRNQHTLRKDHPIFLYCATGRRSRRAAIFLFTRGYTEIYELKGGLKNWKYPLK